MFVNTNYFLASPYVDAMGPIEAIEEFVPSISMKGKDLILEKEGMEIPVVPKEFLENVELGYGLNELDIFSKKLLTKAIKDKAIVFSRIAFQGKIKNKSGFILECILDTSFNDIRKEYEQEQELRSNLYFENPV